MRMRLAGSLLLAVLVSGCGGKKNYGEFLELQIIPNQTIVGPGPTKSCADKTTEKVTGFPVFRSVQGPLINFNNFKLHWTHETDTLYVSAIRVTVEGAGITNGKDTIQLSPDEIDSLLGRASGTVLPKTELESNDESVKGGYAACGLIVGGLKLSEGNATRSFKARVTIDVIGTGDDGNGKFSFIRQKIKGTAEYIALD